MNGGGLEHEGYMRVGVGGDRSVGVGWEVRGEWGVGGR